MSAERKVYSKTYLAEAYGVSISTLHVWLKPILPELRKVGYKKTQKVLKPIQVKIIFTHLGEPD